jgi:hypothetical protein
MGKDDLPCQPSHPRQHDYGGDFKNKAFLHKLLYYSYVIEQGGKNFPAAFDTCKNDCKFIRSSQKLQAQPVLHTLINLQLNICINFL